MPCWRATLPRGSPTYVDADYREPEKVLAEARETLDFDRPIAVLFMGVFGYVEPAEMHRVVHTIVGATPSGSHLAMWDGTSTSAEAIAAAKAQADMGSPYRLSTVDELATCFDGLEMVEPGLVPVTLWRPMGIRTPEPIDAYGGIGRKP